MSWVVLVDGNNVLARSGIADPYVAIGSPEVKTELNKAGSFQFDIYPPHPYYNRLIKMKTKIDVILNDETIFSGRVLYTQLDMNKKRKVYCEGCLAYLLDSIQESYEYDSRVTQFYDMTVHEFLDRLLTRHDKMFVTDKLGVLDNFQGSLTAIGITEGNTDTTERLKKALDFYAPRSTNHSIFGIDDDTKMFKLGTVNAEGTADRFKFEIKGHSKTLDMILETLVDSVGGFMQAYRGSDGWYVLDWKDKFGNENMQPIEWGTNLIELQQDESGVETFTRLYPVGKSSSNTGSTTTDKNITLRETMAYFPVPESMIVYDDAEDEHEEGTELTNPKAAGFYEKDLNDNYVASEDQLAVRGKQYYMPIFGNPLMLKVDDILNYSQVYMGDFTALGVQMDALALNGNVDLSNRPRVSAADMRAAGYVDFDDGDYATLYSMSYGDSSRAILVTPIDQNGVVKTQEEIDAYAEELLDGGFDTIKNRDTEHLLMHYVTGPDTQSRQDGLDAIARKARDLSIQWEGFVDSYFPNGATPHSLEYYEVKQYGYVLTDDTKPVRNKNYYTLRSEQTRSNLESKYGVIVRSVDFSDVNGVNDEAKQLALYKRAVDYIQKTCTDLPEQITLTAIDLRNLDTSIDQMQIGRDIHIKSKPHGIDRHMKCISIDYYLDSPEKNAYVISSKPTGSDAIPRFTEQAETKKKSGSGGGTESSGGTGGSYGGGSDEEKTEEELAALKNHVYYTYGSSGGETMYGSYSQLYAQALGMRIDENGNPLVDDEGHWAWDGVTDAETQRNTIISKLDIRPDTTNLISEINAYYRVIDRSQYDEATTIPTEEVWYEFRSDVKWAPTEDDHVVTGKQYYNAGHQPILNPETKIYSAVSNPEGSPVDNQWYEYVPASDPPYVASTDVSVVSGKTYYEKKTPKEMRWRERNEAGNYVETRDNKPLINYPDKTYYMRRSDGGEKILSSSVEVHPGDVIIQSLNQPIYKQVDDTTGKNPKDEGWYEKNGSSYTKTTDQTPVSGKTYYTRFAISSGVVEVQPGEILIEAINKREDSNVNIKADNINFHGKVNFNSAGGLYLDSDEITSSLMYKKYGTDDGYVYKNVISEKEIEDMELPIGFNFVDNQDNTYTISWEDYDGTPHSITFNRAATPVLSDNGGWSNGTYTVTSNPAASNQPIVARVSAVKVGTISKGNNSYIVIPVEVLDRIDQDLTEHSTGYSQNLNVDTSGLLESGSFSSNSPSGSPYTPSNGKIGFSSVTVNVPQSSGGVSSLNVNSTNKTAYDASSYTEVPVSMDGYYIVSAIPNSGSTVYKKFHAPGGGASSVVGSDIILSNTVGNGVGTTSTSTPSSSIDKKDGAFSGYIWIDLGTINGVQTYKNLRTFSLSVPTPSATCRNTAAFYYAITVSCAGKTKSYTLRTNSSGGIVSFG